MRSHESQLALTGASQRSNLLLYLGNQFSNMLGRTCPEREVASWINVVRQAFFCFENLIQDLVFFPIAESRLADFVIEESVPVCSVAFIGSL